MSKIFFSWFVQIVVLHLLKIINNKKRKTMKKLIFSLSVLTLTLTSCGGGESQEVQTTDTIEIVSADTLIQIPDSTLIDSSVVVDTTKKVK